jgi:Rod binding domain-containing protein
MATVTLNSTAGHAGAGSAHEALVRQTQKWVGMTFYGTLLKQVRNEPFRNDTLDGGQGGKMFGSMLDQQISTRMCRGGGDKLVNAIVNRIEKNSGLARRSAAAAYGTQAKTASPAGSATRPAANNVRIYVAPGFGT